MSIIKHVTLQKIVAHDFRYDPRIFSIGRHVVCGGSHTHTHTHTHTHIYIYIFPAVTLGEEREVYIPLLPPPHVPAGNAIRPILPLLVKQGNIQSP